ncbi:MAG: hypothetical protein ACK47B_20690 [Armatimonadota bacterium]
MRERELLPQIQAFAAEMAVERNARQRRRALDPADFERLEALGFLRAAVPEPLGGSWRSVAESTRPICEALRTLAQGDSSLALVAAMHPSVLTFWLASPEAPAPYRDAWEPQRREVFRSAAEGAWWGTITSEPGSGGDVSQTRTRAEWDGTGYRITGSKHFGSGSGITSFVLTSALPDGEPEPDWFFLDVRGAEWDGTGGMTLLAEWDGHGMTATQSHAFRFEGYPAARFAWPGNLLGLQKAAGGAISCYFAAVVTGIAQVAMATAREQLRRRKESLRSFEQAEWVRAETESWLIDRAYDGMLREVEASPGTPVGTRLGKLAIAELSEVLLTRLCRILGGGSYSRHSPFGYWQQDVRALGFLRPPWALAFDAAFQGL